MQHTRYVWQPNRDLGNFLFVLPTWDYKKMEVVIHLADHYIWLVDCIYLVGHKMCRVALPFNASSTFRVT